MRAWTRMEEVVAAMPIVAGEAAAVEEEAAMARVGSAVVMMVEGLPAAAAVAKEAVAQEMASVAAVVMASREDKGQTGWEGALKATAAPSAAEWAVTTAVVGSETEAARVKRAAASWAAA